MPASLTAAPGASDGLALLYARGMAPPLCRGRRGGDGEKFACGRPKSEHSSGATPCLYIYAARRRRMRPRDAGARCTSSLVSRSRFGAGGREASQLAADCAIAATRCSKVTCTDMGCCSRRRCCRAMFPSMCVALIMPTFLRQADEIGSLSANHWLLVARGLLLAALLSHSSLLASVAEASTSQRPSLCCSAAYTRRLRHATRSNYSSGLVRLP